LGRQPYRSTHYQDFQTRLTHCKDSDRQPPNKLQARHRNYSADRYSMSLDRRSLYYPRFAEYWVQESVKMGQIYDRSFLTITATTSKDSFGGCFNNSGTTQDLLVGGTLVQVTQTLSNGRLSDLLLWSPHLNPYNPLSEPTPLKESPLSQHGWVFQGRILFPRTVHLTSNQLVWECREVYETEDRLPFITARDTRSLSITQELSKEDLGSIWYEWLVESEYASRKFTKMEDRLIAVAGVAKSLQQRTGARYIAGLWDVEFSMG
jgi:hypothetical protein